MSDKLALNGLLAKYGYKANINPIDVKSIASAVLDEPSNYRSAHFFSKRNEHWQHILLSIAKDDSHYILHSGACNKPYAGEHANDVFNSFNEDSIETGITLEGNDYVQKLEELFNKIILQRTVHVVHIPAINPAARAAVNIHGVVSGFLNIVRR